MLRRDLLGLVEPQYLLGGWNQRRRLEVVCALPYAPADSRVVIVGVRYKRCRQDEQQSNANDQRYRDSQADRHQRLHSLRFFLVRSQVRDGKRDTWVGDGRGEKGGERLKIKYISKSLLHNNFPPYP